MSSSTVDRDYANMTQIKNLVKNPSDYEFQESNLIRIKSQADKLIVELVGLSPDVGEPGHDLMSEAAAYLAAIKAKEEWGDSDRTLPDLRTTYTSLMKTVLAGFKGSTTYKDHVGDLIESPEPREYHSRNHFGGSNYFYNDYY